MAFLENMNFTPRLKAPQPVLSLCTSQFISFFQFKAVRKMMDLGGWDDGHLLCHIHEKWGLAVMAQIECLVNGANGMWASVCEEGAALGHACSTITLMNLIR